MIDAYRRRSIVCDGCKGDYSIRDGGWKLILPATDFPDVRSGPELLHLEADLGGTNNIAAQYPETVAPLTAELEKIQRDGRSRPRTERKNK